MSEFAAAAGLVDEGGWEGTEPAGQDLNAALDPLSDNFGENLAAFLADRDAFMLGQLDERMAGAASGPGVVDVGAAAAEMSEAERANLEAVYEAAGVDPGDRELVTREAVQLFAQHAPTFVGTPEQLAELALSTAAEAVGAERAAAQLETGNARASAIAASVARSFGTGVDAAAALEKAPAHLAQSEIVFGEGRRAGIDAVVRATAEEAGRGFAPGERGVMRRHLLIASEMGRLDRAERQTAAASGPARGADGKFATSERDVVAKYFGSASNQGGGES